MSKNVKWVLFSSSVFQQKKTSEAKEVPMLELHVREVMFWICWSCWMRVRQWRKYSTLLSYDICIPVSATSVESRSMCACSMTMLDHTLEGWESVTGEVRLDYSFPPTISSNLTLSDTTFSRIFNFIWKIKTSGSATTSDATGDCGRNKPTYRHLNCLYG